jgi:type IV pilus assembly protein PilA
MKSRRTKIVINRKFQHHYAFTIVVMTVFLVNLFIIFRSIFLSEQPMELSSAEAWGIGIAELILVIGAWFGSLKATHKIAGPVYVLARQINAFCKGDLGARISLRQGDMFQDEAAAINSSLDKLQTQLDTVQNAAEVLQQAQLAGGDTSAQIKTLLLELTALRTASDGQHMVTTPIEQREDAKSPSEQRGFTIIELMIVVAIVSILAVIALPAYQNYTVRTKVSEAMVYIGEAKVTVSERYASTNTMPTNNQVAGLDTPESYDTSDYMKRLEVGNTPVDGTIVVTVKIPGSSANDKQLQLVPTTVTGRIVWTCEAVPGATGLSTNHSPPNCRG